MSDDVAAMRDHWIAEANARGQTIADLRFALSDMLKQMSNPANAEHTLGAYLHGVCVANARDVLERTK